MKKRLLVVDDEPSIRLILQHYLSPHYDVYTCTNGREALDWLKLDNQADIIIADYSMPVIDGLEFIRPDRSGPIRDIAIFLFLCYLIRINSPTADTTGRRVISDSGYVS